MCAIHTLCWFLQPEGTNTVCNRTLRSSYGKVANILLPINHTLTVNHTEGGYVHAVSDRKIRRLRRGPDLLPPPAGAYKVYFTRPSTGLSLPSEPGMAISMVESGRFQPGRTVTQVSHGQWIGGYATWPAEKHTQTITAKIGISFVDPTSAENNLKSLGRGSRGRSAVVEQPTTVVSLWAEGMA